MYGVMNGLIRCNEERVEDLNKRIENRHKPSRKLQMLFSPRPTQTRYVRMPAIDCKKEANVFIKNVGNFSPYHTFTPGNAPWGGYAAAIDQDSRLKNIFFPIQKCPQKEYIPASNSQLYQYQLMTQPVQMTHNLLFKIDTLPPQNMNKCNLGTNNFHNHTRYQVKNIKS